ncbi:uncharacterized protein PADG_03234 [Paracoccidioides brasiliensis Pb18]|uniref:Uncharacterized protein n=1 Tax=Paracoccidioides brasiliensis (strain Pb18) TaxID=502780 RepID=C1G7S9_PARBD|nr:uncharacterized protein PADG_03234 [Paracoccidioides brasiliensis Pb18]EEH47136.1 hypothetical protein PADG_03234 [Paracoccidioides brasiliensis Pb18]
MASSFRGLVQEYLAGHASNVRIGKEISGSEASKKQHGRVRQNPEIVGEAREGWK